MRIGITCYPTYGGSGVVATELGKKLAQIGHEIHFISYALPYRLNRFQSNLFFHEVEVLKYPLFESNHLWNLMETSILFLILPRIKFYFQRVNSTNYVISIIYKVSIKKNYEFLKWLNQ